MIIAVIDQEAEYIDLLKNHLNDLGEVFRVHIDWNFLDNPADFPDFVIADYSPETLQIFAQLKSQVPDKNIPFLFITHKTSFSPEMAALQATGLVDFITKPINEINLISRFTLLIKYARQLTSLAQTQSKLEFQKTNLKS